MMQEKDRHIPVMLQEVIASLAPLEKTIVVDATFGAGGYTTALLQAGCACVIALDRDARAIKAGAEFVQQNKDKLHLIHARFSQLPEVVETLTNQPIDAIVFDIGVSSMQIDEAARGFSFQKDGPLDMRMSGEGIKAADVVNHLPPQDLVRIFRLLGEEKYSTPIARMIAKKREIQPFTTTLELANAIEALVGHRARKTSGTKRPIHPATRVFQALRIYVNEELDELVAGLMAAEKLLRPGGRLGVVSFHSLEDRIVKHFLSERCLQGAPSRYLPTPQQAEPSFSLAFKGAKTANEAEIMANPRARSAKLRVGLRTASPALNHIKKNWYFSSLPPLTKFADTLTQMRK